MPPPPGAQIAALVAAQADHWDHVTPPPVLLEHAQALWQRSGLVEDAFAAKLRRGMLRAAVLAVPAGGSRTAAWLQAVAADGGVGEGGPG